ncbi:MAG: hypothetical protein WA624_23250 [Methylocella sp.]
MWRNRRELLLKRLRQTRDALLQVLLDKPSLPLPLGDGHLDDLTAPCDEIGEKPRRFVLERTDVQLCRRGEMGDHHGIDGIRLGALAQGLRERVDMGRVHHNNGQPSAASYHGCFARRREGSPPPPSRSHPSLRQQPPRAPKARDGRSMRQVPWHPGSC